MGFYCENGSHEFEPRWVAGEEAGHPRSYQAKCSWEGLPTKPRDSRLRIWSQGLLQLKEEDGICSRMVALRRATSPNGDSRASSWPGQERMSGAQLWGPPAARRCGSLCQVLGSVSRMSAFEPCLLALGEGTSGYGGAGEVGPSGKEGVLPLNRQRKKSQ